MNEPPGARMRVGLSALTVAEYFREDLQQDVLLFIDNIFRFGVAEASIFMPTRRTNAQVSASGAVGPMNVRQVSTPPYLWLFNPVSRQEAGVLRRRPSPVREAALTALSSQFTWFHLVLHSRG